MTLRLRQWCVPLLDEGFTNLDVALTALLGTATSAEPGPEATIRWDLPKAVITLNLNLSAIQLHLTSPGYQAMCWRDGCRASRTWRGLIVLQVGVVSGPIRVRRAQNCCRTGCDLADLDR
ncbi:DUF6301 family protein [Rhodococcus sp. SGAir0479]|uniref:DUF6301 family protein n=1 Tax=Rhodococcus sp. SGAir0479 TaxID=2567884 RepID=UPI0020C75EFA|nr:DUF6301 family protein [Rhodococcus sp. SGAir0479]